jgi:[amino group carrier protein]-L-2-aminoadipate/L-glutamate 6-kinase
VLVIKCGGTAGIDRAAVCADVAALRREGETIVVVHGGSREADALGERLDVPPRRLTSPSGVTSRYTDCRTLDVVIMAMGGRLNSSIVVDLLRLGVPAVGLMGLDGALVEARRKKAVRTIDDGRLRVIRDDLSGKVTRVNTHLLDGLLRLGYVPVITPPAFDPEVGPVNVDADRAAAAVAAAMGADRLVLLSNVPGLCRDKEDPSSLFHRLPAGSLDAHMGFAEGRMKMKLIAAREALAGGVSRVVIGDGRIPSPVRAALSGRGTVVEAVPDHRESAS